MLPLFLIYTLKQFTKMKHLKTPQELNEALEYLNISHVIKRINDLKDEYERIRNYEYDQYGDEFDAMDRKKNIQMIFYTLSECIDKLK